MPTDPVYISQFCAPVTLDSISFHPERWRDAGMHFFGLRIPETWQCLSIVADVAYIDGELLPVTEIGPVVPRVSHD